jgi:hypothetical protein
MSTVKTITRQTLQNYVDQKKTVEEMAELLSAPKSKIKEGLKFFDIKLPRASRGGVIWNFVDDEAATFIDDVVANDVDLTLPNEEVVNF